MPVNFSMHGHPLLPTDSLTPLFPLPPSLPPQLINDAALALPERDRAGFLATTEAVRTVTEHYANGIPGE